MSRLRPAALVALPLTPAELWTLHHVLLDRIELERRFPATAEPPPTEVFHAFEKVESGDSWFTPLELRHVRAELREYLGRNVVDTSDRPSVERIIRRITAALAGGRPSHDPLSDTRRTPPR